MSTSLLEALDFTWNQDLLSRTQFIRLSTYEKLCKCISDYAVCAFAFMLRVGNHNRHYKKILPTHNAYVKAHSSLPSNEKVILIIHTKNELPVSPEGYEELEKQSQYKIVFRQIESEKEIAEVLDQLKKQSNQIKALWIRAHGYPQQIILDNQFGISITCNSLFQANFLHTQLNKLDTDAPIILESCFTGKKMPQGQENMAQFISRAANGRPVYAPSREALVIDKTVTFSQEKGFHVAIEGIKASTKFAKGSFLRRMHAVWLAYRGVKEEITRKFVSGTFVNPLT